MAVWSPCRAVQSRAADAHIGHRPIRSAARHGERDRRRASRAALHAVSAARDVERGAENIEPCHRLEASGAPQCRSTSAQRLSARRPSASGARQVPMATASGPSLVALLMRAFRDAQSKTAVGEPPCAPRASAVAQSVRRRRNAQGTFGLDVSGAAHAESRAANGLRSSSHEVSGASHELSGAAHREGDAAHAE